MTLFLISIAVTFGCIALYLALALIRNEQAKAARQSAERDERRSAELDGFFIVPVLSNPIINEGD